MKISKIPIDSHVFDEFFMEKSQFPILLHGRTPVFHTFSRKNTHLFMVFHHFPCKNLSFPAILIGQYEFSTNFQGFFHHFPTVKVPFFAEAPGHGPGGRSVGRCGAWRARPKRKRNAGDADGAAGAWRGGEVNGLIINGGTPKSWMVFVRENRNLEYIERCQI